MRIFGPEFASGADALRILIVGMIVPVMVGTVGFILIMAGRTGWDLVVYLGGFAIDIGVAVALAGPDRPRDPRRGDRAGAHAVVLGRRPAAPGPAVPGDLAVRSERGCGWRCRRLLGRAHDGAGPRRDAERPVVPRPARLGRPRVAPSTCGSMLAVGLSPDRARRRGPAHPSPAHGGGSLSRRSRRDRPAPAEDPEERQVVHERFAVGAPGSARRRRGASHRRGDLEERVHARHLTSGFQAGDRGLGGSGAFRDLRLREPGEFAQREDEVPD